MKEKLLDNLGLTPTDPNAPDNEVMKLLIIPIAMFDYVYNRFSEIHISNMRHETKRYWNKSNSLRGRFFKRVFKDFTDSESADFCDLMDKFQAHIQHDVDILRFSLESQMMMIEHDKRQIISNYYVCIILSQFAYNIFFQICKKHYCELSDFYKCLILLVNHLTKQATPNQKGVLVDLSEEKTIHNAIDCLVYKCKKFNI